MVALVAVPIWFLWKLVAYALDAGHEERRQRSMDAEIAANERWARERQAARAPETPGERTARLDAVRRKIYYQPQD